MRGWTSLPTRREVFLLTFSVSVFVLAFNADAVLSLIRLPATLDRPIGPDGRKAPAHTDALEDIIVGNWDWQPGRIAGVSEAETARRIPGIAPEDGDFYIRGEGRAGAQALWLQGVGQGRYARDPRLGETTVNDEFVRWGDAVPRTNVRFHAPGFTVLDNVTLAFGTFFLVTDDPPTMPSPEALGSSREDHSRPPRDIDWQILPTSNAVPKLGTFGGHIHGPTFVSYDDHADGHTLLTLARLHAIASFPSSSSSASPPPIAPPARLLLPALKTFVDPLPDPQVRTSLGVHPATLKAAYPALAGPLFFEDFDDFTGFSAPVLLDRILVVDRGAAARALPSSSSGESDALAGVPAWLQIFADDELGKQWFEPFRSTLWAFFGLDEANAPRTDELVYIAAPGNQLDSALVRELGKLGFTLHVVDDDTPWAARMRAVVRSSIIISQTGAHLSDAAFIRPGPRAALVELFPPGAFNRDWQVVVCSMDHGYVAFQGERRIDDATRQPVIRPTQPAPLVVDARAVASAVKDILKQH